MGWFWADQTPPAAAVTPHPLPRSDAAPPPGCPMHKSSSSAPDPAAKPSTPSGACPYVPPENGETSKPKSGFAAKINPLNWMPESISNQRAASQTVSLGLDRERSSIPKGDGSGMWEYPSPQQMYNAMLRKGYTDTPQDAVESMVAVHNFLNEGAWAEIIEWERRFGRGIRHGWNACARGEDGTVSSAELGATWPDEELEVPKLVRFQGRPDEMTPKARILQLLGWVYPARFETEPPFDRHDWFVQRHLPEGGQREVRYVIDYYEGPPEPTGEPVFYLDVRPAVDGPTAAVERMVRWSGDIWWRASGGVVREQEKARAEAERLRQEWRKSQES